MALARTIVRPGGTLLGGADAKTIVCSDEADQHTVHETPEQLFAFETNRMRNRG
jgi:hypothetical protein